jgi:hypothetical protein
MYCGQNTEFLYVKAGGKYRGADKSLARPGRKQATVTEDFAVHISYL